MITWPQYRLKHLARTVVDKASDAAEEGPYVGLEAIASWSGRIDTTLNEETSESTGNRFKPGDVLFGKLRPYLGKVAAPSFRGHCSSEALVLRPRSITNTHFLRYRLVESGVIDAINASTYGAKMPRASWDFIGNLRFPVPDLETQKVIADFLDRETARIDQLIEKKQRLVVLLEEKARVTALALVTGKDYPERKSTTIIWAESIPSHWQERAVWMIFSLGRGRVISHEDIAQAPGEYPIYSSQTADEGVLGYIDTYDFEGDYLTWTTDGAKAGTVFRRSGKFNCTNVCGTLKPLNCDLDLQFFQFALDQATDFFIRHDINPKLMNGVMSKIRVPFPPPVEQRLIGEKIASFKVKLRPLLGQIASSIDRLREYRAALITAAVTGQIDVAAWGRRGATDARLDAIEADMGHGATSLKEARA